MITICNDKKIMTRNTDHVLFLLPALCGSGTGQGGAGQGARPGRREQEGCVFLLPFFLFVLFFIFCYGSVFFFVAFSLCVFLNFFFNNFFSVCTLICAVRRKEAEGERR